MLNFSYFCQLKLKSIKKTLKIVGFLIAGMVLILASTYILLQNNRIQNFLVQKVTTELSSTLHTKVSVGHVSFLLFNTLTIENVNIDDLNHKSLISIKNANVSFDLFKLFYGQITIYSLTLDELRGNIEIDKSGKSNIDFILKELNKNKNGKSSDVLFRLTRFNLKQSAINFTNHKSAPPSNNKTFNPNKLRLTDINLVLSIDLLNKDSLSAKILSLSAKDISGLHVNNISTKIAASTKQLYMPYINVELPNSHIQLENILVRYDSLANLKNFDEKVKISLPIKSSHIAFSDLMAFAPQLAEAHGVVKFKGEISGRISNLRLKKIEMAYGSSLSLKGDLDISGLPELDELFVFGKLNELKASKHDIQDLVADLTRKPFFLPKEVDQLGMLKFKGTVSGFMNNLVTYGHLDTNLGDVFADVLFKFENHMNDLDYNGNIKTSNFELGKLLPESKLGNVSLELTTAGTKKQNQALKGKVSGDITLLTFNNYAYRDITLEGKYDGKGYDGYLDIEDQNIIAQFNGKVDLTKQLPVYNFELLVTNAQLHELNLIKEYPNSQLSFNTKINLVGKSLDDINGVIRFENIDFFNKNKRLNYDRMVIFTRNEKNFTHFSVTSDLINGSVSGNFRYSTLGRTFTNLIHHYLPSIALPVKSGSSSEDNHLDVELTVGNLSQITRVLNLPYGTDGTTTLSGYIDEKTNKIALQGFIQTCHFEKQRIDSLQLYISSPQERLQLSTTAKLVDKNDFTKVTLNSSASSNELTNKLIWKNSQVVNNAGELDITAQLMNSNGKIEAQLSLLPSQIIISDSIWNLKPSTILLFSDSTINIHDFRFEKGATQFIHLNGVVSRNHNDSLNVNMSKVNLDFVMKLVKLQGISLGGMVSGKATLFGVLNKPIFEAGLFVKDFSVNNQVIADGYVNSKWDKNNSRLIADGTFLDNKKDTVLTADAVFTPRTDTLDVMYHSRRTNLAFLSRYFGDVVENFKAYASGNIRMHGPLKHGVTFEGDAMINNAQFTVSNMHTSFSFSDSIHMTSKVLEFKNIKVFDQENNPGTLTATLNHNGLFQHLKYDLKLKGNNILGMNTKSVDNEYFFGKAYAKGSVRIFGDEKETNIIVDAKTQPKTKCYTQMGGASIVADNNFVKFVNKNQPIKQKEKTSSSKENKVNVKINLQVEVTQDAAMELIIDPKSGDMISGNGSGNLSVEFDSNNPVKLYGTYTINKGNYLFTLQNVIRKDFKIDKGSSISWNGNPFGAQVDIRGLYPLTASLTDLMDPKQLSTITTRTSVPVNCVLKLSDNLLKPTVTFDVELPTSDEGVKQLVKNIISTNEMMNKQMIYLLVFNKFFTPEYLRNYSFGGNEFVSFGLTTVSAQLNSWFSKMINSNNVSLGLDYKKLTNMSSDEYKAQILYQPNKRWIVNGNVGYRADNISTNKFIKDVDVEYLLSDEGAFRAKVYNRTVDKSQVGTAVDMQGVSLMYKENFSDMNEMKNYYLKLIGLGKKSVK